MSSLQERFEGKYIPVPESGCWLWTDNVADTGYGQIWVNGRPATAHRIAWKLNHGSIPEDACVLHRCDVRSCVNPTHLFLGDRRDNKIDCMAKRRHARGVTQGIAKLTMEQVVEIRSQRAMGITTTKLAAKFGVSKATISAVARNLRYKD